MILEWTCLDDFRVDMFAYFFFFFFFILCSHLCVRYNFGTSSVSYTLLLTSNFMILLCRNFLKLKKTIDL